MFTLRADFLHSEIALEKYGKSIIAFLYAVAFVVIPQISGDHHVDPPEAVNLCIAIVTAGAVYLIPMFAAAKWTKSLVAFLLAGLNIAATVILDGSLSAQDWLLIATSALGAIGIGLAPAVSVLRASAPGMPTGTVAVGWGSDN
jgi:uncharacterized membrane protein